MAKAADKPATAPVAAKVDKVKKERVAKTDGPVAKVAAFVKANEAKLRDGTMTKTQAVDALKALGVVGGTIGVQLPRRLKERGIKAEKGSRATPKPPKAPKAEKVAKTNGNGAVKAPLEPAKPKASVATVAAAKKPAGKGAQAAAKKKK